MKELIENSLDAGSDRISVHVQVPSNSSSTETSAGLFSIQVTDNGSGISKEDLDLLCERHATSKLVNVSDLRTVGTFGFRGEALASCSQVARVEIVTKSRETQEEVAWKASYVAGKLTGDPIPLAGNYGTTINVKDLFYANRVRREALLNSSEEYQKIVQVMQAYALNQAGRCAFSLSRRRDRLEMQTSTGDDHVTVIKNLWNEEVGEAMLPFEIEADSGVGIENGSGGLATRTTFHKLKSPQVIIFLNGRLIEHPTLRRAILQSFALHLPTSPPAHPFVYLNLRIRGSHVDVNVHPSKRQVVFLEEAEVVERVVRAIDQWVLRRQYETQNLKPILISSSKRGTEKEKEFDNFDQNAKKSKPSACAKISTLYPSQRVLTDTRNHRIDAFLYHSSHPQRNGGATSGWSPIDRKENVSPVSKNNLNVTGSGVKMSVGSSSPLVLIGGQPEESKESQEPKESKVTLIGEPSSASSTSATTQINSSESQDKPDPLPTDPEHKLTQESTSSELTELISKHSNPQLSKLLQSSLVVGLIDSRWSLLQSGTNLLLCDTSRLAYELFFSLLAIDGDGRRMFEVDVGVGEVFRDVNLCRQVEELLMEKKEALERVGVVFRKISCDDGLKLVSLPVILPGQRCPTPTSLRVFIHRLALLSSHPLHLFSELAYLYAQIETEEWPDWEEYVRHVVLAGMRDPRAKFSMRDDFRVNDEITGDCTAECPPPVQIITNTETLYKSFERC